MEEIFLLTKKKEKICTLILTTPSGATRSLRSCFSNSRIL